MTRLNALAVDPDPVERGRFSFAWTVPHELQRSCETPVVAWPTYCWQRRFRVQKPTVFYSVSVM